MVKRRKSKKKEKVLNLKPFMIGAFVILIGIGLGFFIYNTINQDNKYITQVPDSAVDLDLQSAHHKGDINAPIIMIEFGDFECRFCGAFYGSQKGLIASFKTQDPTYQPGLPGILSQYVNTGEVVLYYKHFPLDPSCNEFTKKNVHPNACKAAEASECAGEQGQFWEYHNILFENQDSLDSFNLKKYAADLQLNEEAFNTCLDSGKYTEKIKRDIAEASTYGIKGTPTFVINNLLAKGSLSFSIFEEIFNSELGD